MLEEGRNMMCISPFVCLLGYFIVNNLENSMKMMFWTYISSCWAWCTLVETNVSWLNLGHSIFCTMTSVDFTAQTYTQTCPGASSTLHLQCSWWMEVIQLCPSTFVFVYPYRSEAWLNPPEISHRISRCCVDLCDPISSTIMICVCAVACWGVATLAASFSPA